MALFGKKKGKGDDDTGETPNGDEAPKLRPPAPDKATSFFNHARTVEATGNIEYALTLWIRGLRQDPSDIGALEKVANLSNHLSQQNKGKISKDVLKATQHEDASYKAIDKWLEALVQWGYKVKGAAQAVRATELTHSLGLEEQAYWIGEKALRVATQDPKPSKDLLIKLMEVFGKIHAFDLAVQAGDAAVRVDPADGQLAAQVRNMSAQATMSSGGYDTTGEQGGFRKNIKDLDAQAKLTMEDQISKSAETIDSLIASAKADFESRPDDPHAINKYAEYLLQRGKAETEDEKTAERLLLRGFEITKQYKFRLAAGKVKLRRNRRILDQIKAAVEAKPDDAELRHKLEAAQSKFRDMEIAELTAAVENYPTDLSFKYQLGTKCFEAGRYNDAIPMLQQAAGDAKVRARAQGMLGKAFLRVDFADGAVETYREALSSHPVHTDDLGMDLRYGLMTALEAKARGDRDAKAAEEAEKIAASLAIEQFNYRDVRERRTALKQLVTELRNAG